MNCLCCGSENLKGHVVLEYDMPLSKRGGGIKLGGIKVTALDVRAAWEAKSRRPIFCFDCGTKHVFDMDSTELVQEEG